MVKQEEDEIKTITFKYDSFGRRIEKKVEETEEGKTETKTYAYVYDHEDILLEFLAKTEDGKTKTETTRYLHGPGIDEPLAVEKKGETFFYHADGLGSITALTDSKQKIVESYTYSSFGEVKRKGDKVKNVYTFTGREWDKEIGLYYYRARYYDATAGRFISFDPILHPAHRPPPKNSCRQSISPTFEGLKQDPQTLNPFVYVRNNPNNFVDPTGFIPECKCGAQPRFNGEKFTRCLLLTHGIFPAPAIGCVVVVYGCVTGNVGACILVPAVCGVEGIIIYGCYDAAFECPQ